MSWLMDAADAISPMLAEATGLKPADGLPDTIKAGCCGVLLNEVPIAFDFEESGGESDRAATLTLYACFGETGNRSGDMGTAERALLAMDAFKAAIEADMSLGGAVRHARLASATLYSGRADDNKHESTIEMKVEVDQW